MNFFEHQEKARKQSRWIIIAFIAVALLIVAVIDVIVLLIFSVQSNTSAQTQAVAFSGMFDPDFIRANSSALLGSSAITGGAIGLASLGKIASLRSGGGKVARDMGATIVTPDTKDPLRRRLYNVVEEIALASGTPVPEVYVMENEPGINAFAAGYTPADAAVAVTQGTLERLNRNELQGVIAHEFSHILNGDMRINIRMMGVIFGIMVIAILGRKFLHASHYRLSSSRDNSGNVIVGIGIALMVVGYVGLFFARWMKSALSRQREYLADASAVQFTRDPSSISGALKKIAAYNHSSYLRQDPEEVGHMLFGSGYRSLMFATHPPLEKRIERLDRRYDANEIKELAEKLQKQEQREHIQAEEATREQEQKASGKSNKTFFDVDNLIDNIGAPSTEGIAAAAVLAASIPTSLSNPAHSLEWAPEVLFYCLLDRDEAIREQQLLVVVKEMGDISESKIQHLLNAHGPVATEQRLPLLEICFPMIKRRPISEIEKILETAELLAIADNTIDSYEYLLTRLIKQYIFEAHVPNRTRLHGNKRLKACMPELTTVVSVLASHGQNSDSDEGLQLAKKAFSSGMAVANISHPDFNFSDDWQSQLDKALTVLDKLSAKDKSTVIAALARTVLDDGKVITEEHEMLRVICGLLHVPLPLFQITDAA